MVSFSSARLKSLFHAFEGKRVAVIGDLMVDRYYWGTVARISPEAPVPVVEVDSESTRLGGAANVANNVASLGGIPLMVGVVGDDDAGKILRGILNDAEFPLDGVVVDRSRPTTVKTRVIAHHQHVVRIDQEVKEEISPDIQQRILDLLKKEIEHLDAILLEDYNKGVIVRTLIEEVVDIARKHNRIVTVDPKFNNFFDYQHVSVFKPNRRETEEALGIKLHSQEDIERAGKMLVEKLNAENVLLTLGEQGISLFERKGEITHVPTAARKVADVSGAGDTVISTLTVALASGATIREASTLANIAGGVVCGEVGIVPIDKKVLLETVLKTTNHQ